MLKWVGKLGRQVADGYNNIETVETNSYPRITQKGFIIVSEDWESTYCYYRQNITEDNPSGEWTTRSEQMYQEGLIDNNLAVSIFWHLPKSLFTGDPLSNDNIRKSVAKRHRLDLV